MNTAQISNEEQSVWLSMIIPVYQAERYLEPCIESVLHQDFTDFELILVDDGSVDASAQICLRYAKQDQRIRYFHKGNGGSLSARLYGIERALGQYIGFMDADDYLINEHVFLSLYKSITKHDCDLVQFGYVKKFNHMKRTARTVNVVQYASEDEFRNRDYPLLLCSFWDQSRLTTNGVNKLYRRSLLDSASALKNENRIFWGDDLIMNLYLLRNCRSALFLPDVFYVYRQFSGGTSRLSKREMLDLNMIKKHQLRFLESWTGEKKEVIEAVLYSEVAGWMFAYIRKCIGVIEQDELLRMTEEILEYPAFQKARAYYKKHPQINGKAIELLRKGEPKRYIIEAEEMKVKPGLKARMVRILKWIYYRI